MIVEKASEVKEFQNLIGMLGSKNVLRGFKRLKPCFKTL